MRYPALESKGFVLLWSGLLVSNVGTWMQNVAQSWVLYQRTGKDPLYLGWLGFSFALPMVILPPFGGVIADRAHRIRLLVITQSSALLLAAALAVLTWRGLLEPWHLLAATALGAVLLAFDNPARQSLVPDLVPREHLQNALSLNSATFTGAALVGPAIAGALLDRIGPAWLFALNALSYVAPIVAIVQLRDVPPHAPKKPGAHAVLGGLQYVAREPAMRSLLAIAAVCAILARSYPQLLPIFADDLFHQGAQGYGALLSAGGLGALVGAVILSSSRDIAHKGRVVLASGAILAATVGALAVAGRFSTALILATVAAIASTIFTTMISTVIQLRVPPELRGRVISLYVVTLIGMPYLGALVLAAVARFVGPPHGARYAILAGALGFFAVLGLSLRPIRRLREQ